MFQALCVRRNVRIRYERFAHAMTASAVYNVNRRSVDDPIIRPYDYVMSGDEAAQRDKLMQVRRYIKGAIGRVPADTTLDKLLQVRLKVIADISAQGVENAEELFDECWPSMKPKDTECQK